MYRLVVPQDNTNVWAYSDHGRVALTADAETWLEETIGYRQFKLLPDGSEQEEAWDGPAHWMIMNSYHSLTHRDGTAIWFSDPGHAALFKLTFF